MKTSNIHLSDCQNHNNQSVLGPLEKKKKKKKKKKDILEKFDPTTSPCLVDDKIYAKLSCSLDLV